MQIFVSYSRRDERAVELLAADLDRARHTIWRDRELGGGEEWWREILDQIRRCDVFLLALSNNTIRSRPCLAELDYAERLHRPVLPVQIGPVDSLRTSPIASRQVVDYRPRVALAAAEAARAAVMIDLVAAAAELAARARPRPDPLPAEPPIPYEYLMQLRHAIEAPELPGRRQLEILTQLRQALRDEEDPGARHDVVELLGRLRRHPDTSYRNALDIDELLARHALPAPQPGRGGPEPRRRVGPDRFGSEPAGPTPSETSMGAEPAGPLADLDPGSDATSPATPTETPTGTEQQETAAPHPPVEPERLPDSVLAALVGVGFGALGIGQLSLLAVFEKSRLTPETFNAATLALVSVVLLLFALTGIGVGLVAPREERLRWVGIGTSVLGALVVVAVLLHYMN